jgi:hypothetical protein
MARSVNAAAAMATDFFIGGVLSVEPMSGKRQPPQGSVATVDEKWDRLAEATGPAVRAPGAASVPPAAIEQGSGKPHRELISKLPKYRALSEGIPPFGCLVPQSIV